ncbi:ABC transporter permease [Paraliomyxa miuraensis]|uniref:ABC transporter permease n=1 Tax=Paraliomyxa miuraensis TaxID=376150 RepID=UPI0022543BC8|nr:ABC-2 family transporter protein [Paraliomyxa miuraensis]MCX4241670.1 ABC-2 family transporter protein [Paraliomyxa miuraensis]
MLESLRVYGCYVAVALRGQLQYRGSVVMGALGNLMVTGVELFGLWALFDRFGQIQGWTLAEVALLYGMANVSLALAEIVGRGFRVFDQLVKSGDFDRLLLRPRGTAFQVAAQHFELARVGRLIQGLAVLVYALVAQGLLRPGAELVLVVGSIVGGACTFMGVFVLQATVAFFTIESLELFAIITYGGVETAQYPLSIYGDGLRRFFTWVVPLAFANFVPGVVVLGRPERFGPEWLAWASPLVGVGFFWVCLRVWRVGERYYRSTGS